MFDNDNIVKDPKKSDYQEKQLKPQAPQQPKQPRVPVAPPPQKK